MRFLLFVSGSCKFTMLSLTDKFVIFYYQKNIKNENELEFFLRMSYKNSCVNFDAFSKQNDSFIIPLKKRSEKKSVYKYVDMTIF